MMLSRHVFIGEATGDRIERDDGGQSWTLEIPGMLVDDRMFVRVQSWAEDKQHPEFDSLRGKFVMVTVEAFDSAEDLAARNAAREAEIAYTSGKSTEGKS